jgi:hypothetical protein
MQVVFKQRRSINHVRPAAGEPPSRSPGVVQSGRTALDPLADFLPMDRHFRGGHNADLHPVAVNRQNRDRLSSLAAQNQHGQILLVKDRSPFPAGSGSSGREPWILELMTAMAVTIHKDTISKKRIKGNLRTNLK